GGMNWQSADNRIQIALRAALSVRERAKRSAERRRSRKDSGSMALVNVQVWDATGNKRQEVQMPDDAPVNRILAVLLEKMNFPQYAPDGQPLSYKLHHRSTGKQLLDTQTLADVNAK